jgi:CheY-like chemotaxis protein
VPKHKLLLADDSVTIQKVVQLTFADEGIDVSIAGDGDMAMLKFLESEPDIVLADVHMPGLNGYQVCERIKENGDSVPVVLLVGSFEPFDTEEANRVGADGFLTKPFQSIRQLVEVVSNLLASRGNDTAASASSQASGGIDESFVDTKEIPAYGDTGDLGDSGMDDEMIETAPARDFLEVDTLPRYSEVVDQDIPDETGVDDSQPEVPVDEASADEDAPTGETAEVQDSTYEFTEAPTADLTAETEIALENEAGPDADANFEDTLETPEPEAAPDDDPNGEADDSNLLEIPFIRSIVPPLSRISGAPVAAKAPPALTPEFIEEVTQRVMERLSSGAFRDLVKEVVPQVVREVTEEQMKD